MYLKFASKIHRLKTDKIITNCDKHSERNKYERDGNRGRDRFLDRMANEGPFVETTFVLKSRR